MNEGKHGMEESQEQIHKIRIIWKYVQNLEKGNRHDPSIEKTYQSTEPWKVKDLVFLQGQRYL